ncbi:helix-turn-helix transcriptional regulator [Microbacterium oxydans]|uniref:helix-turn-helix domain-containing protein n=1 Tax=Microbacterium oxydans TaxID=82380 RepID=UPI0033312648
MTNYHPTVLASEIASRLRGQIARYDISQAELAALCDVSQSQFSKIIRGTRPMTVDQMAVICSALEIDLGELLASVERFLENRDLVSSPVLYVEEEVRLAQPQVRTPEYLDSWGRAALERIQASVPARREDYDVVANESINEFPDGYDTDYDHA